MQTPTNMLSAIRTPILRDIEGTNTLILESLTSEVPLIQTITNHILQSGGKRLRLLITLLSSRACGYQDPSNEHWELGAVIEFMHTATLLHDDVIDESELRRGNQSANTLFGNEATVLVGDFLYSRAFQLLAKRSHHGIMQVLAETTNAIAEGEVLQLMHRQNTSVSRETYDQIIYQKTAKLFEASASVGAVLTQQDTKQDEGRRQGRVQALATYGRSLGMAFQIIDDLLDYTGNEKTAGKNPGDDLAEGKMTLPVIIAMQRANTSESKRLQQAIRDADRSALPNVLEIIVSTEADKATREAAIQEIETANAALEQLDDSAFKNALLLLLEFCTQRDF